MPEPDPELEELFREPADLEVVRLLKAARPATPPMDAHFRSYLRSKLMAEARRTLPASPRRSWFSGLNLGIGPVPALAAVAAAFLIVLGYEVYTHQPGPPSATAVRVTSPLSDKTNVATDEIRIDFSGPVDRGSVEKSIVIQPATAVDTHWEGPPAGPQTLVVVPRNQLAANTTYTVELRPAPATPAPRPSASVAPAPPKATPAPVVVRFVTAPSPPPPVSTPTFASANLTFLSDSRLADPGAFGVAAWTGDGQIVATRPRSNEKGASTASPTANPSPPAGAASSSSGAMDLWLMSPRGIFIRRIAADVLLPAVSPQGGRIAFWRQSGDQYGLFETSSSATTDEAVRLATISAQPAGAPIWVGDDGVGYVDGGAFKLVDLQGNVVPTPAIGVSGAAAGSPIGRRLAVETPTGSAVYILASPHSIALPSGATGFSWSQRGDLAFIVQRSQASELWILKAGASTPSKLAASQPGDSWSSVNWSPDAASLLFSNRSTAADGSVTRHAFLVDAAGGGPRQFGSGDYETLDWSPDGRTVLFTRRDETGQPALWVATLRVGALSDLDRAQQDALTLVTTFMDARLRKDAAAAQAELSADALSAYGEQGQRLLAPASGRFERWYPITVQLAASKPQSFLIGVRVVEASDKLETGFHEENLTLTRHESGFLIDKAEVEDSVSLRQGGPSVVSVDVRPDSEGQQILVHFDSDLAPGTVKNASSIQVRDSTGASLPVTSIVYDEYTHVATLKVKLTQGTYQLVVTTGVEDIQGRAMAQDYTSPIVITPVTG